jgi:hypothetical protein
VLAKFLLPCKHAPAAAALRQLPRGLQRQLSHGAHATPSWATCSCLVCSAAVHLCSTSLLHHSCCDVCRWAS